MQKQSISISTLRRLIESRKMTEEEVVPKYDLSGDSLELTFQEIKEIAKSLVVPVSSLIANNIGIDANENDLNNGIKIGRAIGAYERSSQRRDTLYYTYHHLAKTKTQPTLMPLRITIHCLDPERVVMNAHETREFVYVSVGPIRFHWSMSECDHIEILEQGDSVYIEPNIDHSFTAILKEGEIIAINY